ncbi:MAG: RrF2 family transcriptional regulator [Clostridia bacterium]|nr:RrF2 family transcriptional regulator [Clostridia bacterium]
MVSTKGRYAVRVMIDLAQHRTGAYIPMKEVAARQEISLKYLEKILPVLTKNGLIEGVHGKGGGYRLLKDPEICTVWEVLNLAEGDLAPVSCLAEGAAPCARAAYCQTLPMWEGYYNMTKAYFSGITIQDLADTERAENWTI